MRGDRWSGAFKSNADVMDEASAARNQAMELEERRAETVEANEASWLVERIGRDGVLHENERALVAYLKQESPYVDPTLESLFEKVA